MGIFLNDDIKSWLKNSVNFYYKLSQKKEMSNEEAIVYTLLIKSRGKNSFMELLYSLANVEFKKISVNENDTHINKNDRFKYYNKIREHIEKLEERFKKDFLQNINGKLDIGFFEIVCLEMIYYPKETQELFQLDFEKYCQLTEVLKEKVLLEYKSYKNKKIDKSDGSISRLSKYGVESLTDHDFSYNPLVGNEQALRKIIKILLSGNSLILLGEAGVGKTTLVNGLAYNIKTGNVPDGLKNKKIIMLPISGIVAGTEYVGTLEKHVNDIISYAKDNKDTIFYMDEIHMILGAGQVRESNIDVSNLLKPYISDKTLQIIGATTNSEFDKSIATNPAFRRRFDTITLSEPTEKEVFEIAMQYISIKKEELRIEWDFNNNFLNLLVSFTNSKNRNFFETINNPNLTLNIIDGIFSSALYYGKSVIDKNDVIEGIADNEILSSTKKEELLRKLSSDEFFTSHEEPKQARILTLHAKNIHKLNKE